MGNDFGDFAQPGFHCHLHREAGLGIAGASTRGEKPFWCMKTIENNVLYFCKLLN
jgi:hypothetical protein